MSLWIRTFVPTPQAPLRLFCFSYVGGTASVFRGWPQHFGPLAEVCAVQLPGRENRLREQPFTDLYALAERVATEVAPRLREKPFAFFGHSMGALLAFEVTRELRRRALPRPERLFVSAAYAPQHPDHPDPPRHTLPEAELIEELRRLGGTPDEVLQHEELLQLLLPTVRADFSLVDTYRYREEDPLDTPITAFGGRQDPSVTEEHLRAWQPQTRADFTLRIFPGDHFYLHAYEAEVVREIARRLTVPPPRERGEG